MTWGAVDGGVLLLALATLACGAWWWAEVRLDRARRRTPGTGVLPPPGAGQSRVPGVRGEASPGTRRGGAR